MNNPLNLNQTPENIAEEAIQLFSWHNQLIFDAEINRVNITYASAKRLAIILIENIKHNIPDKIQVPDYYGIQRKIENPVFTTLSEVLEILNKEIK